MSPSPPPGTKWEGAPASCSARHVPPEARAAVLAQAGIPEDVATALLGMYHGLASGRVVQEEGTERRRATVSLSKAIARVLTKIRDAA
jgi:hypothetical protein